jgi:hypothetical protein
MGVGTPIDRSRETTDSRNARVNLDHTGSDWHPNCFVSGRTERQLTLRLINQQKSWYQYRSHTSNAPGDRVLLPNVRTPAARLESWTTQEERPLKFPTVRKTFFVLPVLFTLGLSETGWSANPTIQVTPGSVTLRGNATQQFTAAVQNLANPTVRWMVNDILGGNATVGTITPTGLYTAPSAAPSPNQVRVKGVLVVPNAPPTAAPVQDDSPVTIQNPTPVIRGFNPVRLKPTAMTFRVQGVGFVPGMRAFISSRTTNLELTVSAVTPTEVTLTGTLEPRHLGWQSIWFTNPAPGSTTSTPRLVRVTTWDTPLVSDVDAYRFLEKATWGPTPQSLDDLQRMGYRAWLDAQYAAPASNFPPNLIDKPLEWAQDYFFQLAQTGNDQLRQRLAFALHQIFVVSGVEVDCAEAFIPYYRIFLNDGFNFRTVLKNITLNPAMGEYLDMVNNKKTAPNSGMLPNENYAREVLQLFTIGLQQLNIDGTPRLDFQGQPIPT